MAGHKALYARLRRAMPGHDEYSMKAYSDMEPADGRQTQKAAETQGPPAARARRPRPGRNSGYARHGGEDPRRVRALRLRAGGDAGDRIHRRARQVPARPGPAERGRVLVSGRRRAVAEPALRP